MDKNLERFQDPDYIAAITAIRRCHEQISDLRRECGDLCRGDGFNRESLIGSKLDQAAYLDPSILVQFKEITTKLNHVQNVLWKYYGEFEKYSALIQSNKIIQEYQEKMKEVLRCLNDVPLTTWPVILSEAQPEQTHELAEIIRELQTEQQKPLDFLDEEINE